MAVRAEEAGAAHRREWRVQALLWCSEFTCRAPLVAVGPVLPLILRDLHLSSTVASSLTGLPLLLMGVLSFPAGVLVDRWGAWRVLALGLWITVLCGALRGLAWSPPVLLAAAAGVGVGISLM